MFSIIIGTLSVLLVAALVIVGVLYLGGGVTDNLSSIELGQLLNEGQHVQAAVTLYKANNGQFPIDESSGGGDSTLEKLKTGGYLREDFDPTLDWSIDESLLVRDINDSSESQCITINENAGYPGGCPVCGDDAGSSGPADVGQPVCTCVGSSEDYC